MEPPTQKPTDNPGNYYCASLALKKHANSEAISFPLESLITEPKLIQTSNKLQLLLMCIKFSSFKVQHLTMA